MAPEWISSSTPISSSPDSSQVGRHGKYFLTADLEFYVPGFFFTELTNNLDDVEKKADLERHKLELLLDLLFERIRGIPREEFEDHLSSARELIAESDPDDVPFLALALHLDADVWTDDEHFQEQDAVAVWRTDELVKRLE